MSLWVGTLEETPERSWKYSTHIAGVRISTTAIYAEDKISAVRRNALTPRYIMGFLQLEELLGLRGSTGRRHGQRRILVQVKRCTAQWCQWGIRHDDLTKDGKETGLSSYDNDTIHGGGTGIPQRG
jgi:hypothetical protein